MSLESTAPWHRESYDRFLHEALPALLAARLPLEGYRAEAAGPHSCRLRLVLSGRSGDVTVEYAEVPQPGSDGAFLVDEQRLVVLPRTDDPALDLAPIRCVGEQLLAYFEERLGEAPEHLEWTEPLARMWLPLPEWVRDFLAERAQCADPTNWLASQTQLRRLVLGAPNRSYGPAHWGRICPIETAEGPNHGRILSIALGATIRSGRLEVREDSPAGVLGLTASMVPLLEHNDLNRQLMGANMMRQWIVPEEPEPALVQTGNEPDEPGFWCGRNLLTAFVSWGAETHEDGAVISESCAARLGWPYPAEPGDKLSNRHGIKAVVCGILPDAEMPHLPDGTPVEIAWSFSGLLSRMGLIGALREAVLGRIARVKGGPVVVPPFGAPSDAELRAMLREAGLTEDGMVTLSLGRGGKPLARPSTVGWVYWGRLHHLARAKLLLPDGTDTHAEAQDEETFQALAAAGAWENALEIFNTRASGREDAGALAERLTDGPVTQAPPPAPQFSDLAQRLAAGGVRLALEEGALAVRLAPPEGEVLRLALPVPHPWLPGQELREVGLPGELQALLEAEAAPAPYAGHPRPSRGQATALRLWMTHSRLAKMIENGYPEALVAEQQQRLSACVAEYFDELLTPEDLQFKSRALFSGRTVSALGAGLRSDQVGVPEELAWALFGPLAARSVGSDAVRDRRPEAASALDEVMRQAWVLLIRLPPGVVQGTAPVLAFHPVRVPGSALRPHLLVCGPMDTDFDGDQLAVTLPVTEAAQEEAGARLSIAGRIRQDPRFLDGLQGWHAGKWGLAWASLTEAGRQRIHQICGVDATGPDGFVSKSSLAAALRGVLGREGAERVLAAMQELIDFGFQAAKESGASMIPFVGEGAELPPAPDSDEPAAWERYTEEVEERLLARSDYDDPALGMELLSIKSGARGAFRQLLRIISPWCVRNEDRFIVIRHSYREGLTPEEMRSLVWGHWDGLQRIHGVLHDLAENNRAATSRGSYGVLARARRSRTPAAVFARAAASGETDPLTDPESRLFVGLPPAK